jgi:transcriptional regulator with XRE-family HTH domain
MYKLAKLANVSRPSISFIESGRHASMNSDALSRIARVLGVTTDSLLYGDVLEDEDEPPLATTRVGGLGGIDRGQKGNHLLETIL